MFLYVHGFASTGQAFKGRVLSNFFGRENVICPTLSAEPACAMAELEAIVTAHLDRGLTLVGSSLGGFYSIYLSEKYKLKAVLINPVVDWRVMQHMVGRNKNWQTGQWFEFTAEACRELELFSVSRPTDSRYLLLLQRDDELLDYRKAIAFMPSADCIVKSGGGHHYNDFNGDMGKVKAFAANPNL